MEEHLSAQLIRERLLAIVSAFFGGLGVLLAGLGLFGVTAYEVGRRRGELGIRLALGATPRTIERLVVSRVATLVCAGLAIGVLLTWWVARFVDAQLLYGVQSHDLPTIVVAAMLLGGIALTAGWLPARRAGRVDPVVALRFE
jgi:ABC-type antimicrobial peptide transport system permease subunit